jgi:aspartyl-tRNA(Asn)/glutamyl-tRNA(Gln) amidotransferase subunit C
MPAEREDFPVARVAALARLRLSPAESALYETQLSQILAFVGEVASAPSDPAARAGGLAEEPARERPDAVSPSLPAESALANAPDASDAPHLVRVPKVIG